MLERSVGGNTILVFRDGKEVLEKRDKLLAYLGVDGIIRIRENEYREIDTAKKYFAHFNLECTNHEVDKKYIFGKIIRAGSYNVTNGMEILPLISLENAYTVKCLDAKNYLTYKDITPEYFLYSLPSIQNVNELKSIIFARYSESLPNLSKEEIEKLGVGYTLLGFEK